MVGARNKCSTCKTKSRVGIQNVMKDLSIELIKMLVNFTVCFNNKLCCQFQKNKLSTLQFEREKVQKHINNRFKIQNNKNKIIHGHLFLLK